MAKKKNKSEVLAFPYGDYDIRIQDHKGERTISYKPREDACRATHKHQPPKNNSGG